MMQSKDIVAGLGEIGKPILQLLSSAKPTVGYDVRKELMDTSKFLKYESSDTDFLHICIPFTKHFIPNTISLVKKFCPKCVVIHSTIEPNTTKKLQQKLSIPVIYSATRGVHKRMLYDLKRYTKFFAIDSSAPNSKWAARKYKQLLKKCGTKTKQMSSPLTLELAKIICDTSYYGWLITYAQISNIIAMSNNVDYNEMWSFSDEIHKFLGNRPKMYPGVIGGHCVIPNLALINNENLDFIKSFNDKYMKNIDN